MAILMFGNRLSYLKVIISISLILGITFISFYPCLKNNFTNWDDDIYLTENKVIQHLSLNNIKKIFTSYVLGNYHPLTILSYALEYSLFKLNPFPYHLTNLILYLLNCLLVFWLIYLLSQKISVSLITAIFFGVHPLHVESVAWASGMKDMLYALFFLGACISYCYYLRGRGAGKFYHSTLILFAFSLLSKQTAVSLPLVLLLIDYLYARRLGKAVILEKIPFFILSLAFGIIAVISQYASAGIRSEQVYHLLYNKIMIASYAIIFYLHKIWVPVRLSIFYPFPAIGNNFNVFLPPLLITIILVILIIASGKYTRKVIFGSGFFLVMLIPVLQFIPFSPSMVFDRYAYIPSLGIFYIVSEALFWLYKKRIRYIRLLRFAILVTLFLITCVLALLTSKRCQIWHDGLTLWSDVLEKYRDPTAYNNRGELFLEQGEYDKAYQDFIEAIKLNPKWANPYINLGNLYIRTGKNAEAIATFMQVLKIDPQNADAYVNLANIYQATGREQEAITLYEKAGLADKRHILAYYNLGLLYKKLNNKEGASRMLNKTIDLKPDFLPAYPALVSIYKSLGDEKRVLSVYKKAIEHNLDYFDAYLNIGNLVCDNGQNRKAIVLYKQAIRINPDSAETYVNIGSAYCYMGKNKEAVSFLKKAIKLDPNLGVAYNNLAVAYYYDRKYSLAIEYCGKAIQYGYKVSPRLLELLKPYTR